MIDPQEILVPEELIAQVPAIPRDASRLLILDKKSGEIKEDIFRNLGQYLSPHSVIVLNETKVVPARLPARTESGSLVELLYLRAGEHTFFALSPKKLHESDVLLLGNHELKVRRAVHGEYEILPSFAISELSNILENIGITPLPPYIKNNTHTEPELRLKYQTVFAKKPGSIAAPTASLHFTPELLASLESAGHTLAYVTLHVGMGTFMNPTAEQIKSSTLHEEWYEISHETARLINVCKEAGRAIIPVGTTALRTIESASTDAGVVEAKSGTTNLFIQPGYTFKITDHMITNFHVPRSSLRMLVAAFAGAENIVHSYEYAIEKKFRFYSFGDAMLIL